MMKSGVCVFSDAMRDAVHSTILDGAECAFGERPNGLSGCDGDYLSGDYLSEGYFLNNASAALSISPLRLEGLPRARLAKPNQTLLSSRGSTRLTNTVPS